MRWSARILEAALFLRGFVVRWLRYLAERVMGGLSPGVATGAEQIFGKSLVSLSVSIPVALRNPMRHCNY